jgi:hypothetical protein
MNFIEFINAYQVDHDASKIALENDAKRQMYATTETSIEEFARSLRAGSLAYFVQNVIEIDPINPFDSTMLNPAKQIVKVWMQDLTEKTSAVHVNDVATVYNAIFGQQIRPAKLTALLSHHGIAAPNPRIQAHGKRKAGWEIPFKLNGYDINELIADHFTPVDAKYFSPKEVKTT